MKAYLGCFFIFLAAIFWALIGPVARFSLGGGIDALELAFWRAAIGGGLFLLHAAMGKGLKVRSAKDLFAFALFGACSMGGFFACNQFAIQTGGAALAAVMLYTAPAWVAIFSRFFFKSAVTRVKLTAIALSMGGVICISIAAPAQEHGAQGLNIAGAAFGALSGFLYSTHYIFTAKYLKTYSTHTLYAYCALFGALALFPFVPFSPKAPAHWAVALCLGGICTYGAYLAYCAGIKRLEPTKAAVLATLEPVIATAMAWWIWGEIFTSLGWIGAGLVMAAVALLVLDPARSPAGEKTPPAATTAAGERS